MLPRMAPCREALASGEHVVGLVRLDHDEEMGPLRGMYGSMEAELEVQRTIKRAELTAFFCLLKKVIGLIKVHVDNKGIIDRLWKGESKCIDPNTGDADLRIKIWEELQLQRSKEILVEVEHVKAHRTKREKKDMSPLEKFVTEGNEQGWTKVSWQKREQRQCSRNEKMCTQLYSVQPALTALWKNKKIVRSPNRCRKKNCFLTRKRRKRSIDRSGVQKRKSIDA